MLTFIYLLVCLWSGAIEVDYTILGVVAIVDIAAICGTAVKIYIKRR